jgi:hypothetical protein
MTQDQGGNKKSFVVVGRAISCMSHNGSGYCGMMIELEEKTSFSFGSLVTRMWDDMMDG